MHDLSSTLTRGSVLWYDCRQSQAAGVLAETHWLPAAVTAATLARAAMEHAPLDADSAAHALSQRAAVSRAELRKLGNQLAAARRRLSTARSALQAVDP